MSTCRWSFYQSSQISQLVIKIHSSQVLASVLSKTVSPLMLATTRCKALKGYLVLAERPQKLTSLQRKQLKQGILQSEDLE